ncbi:MAG: sigma-54-dependent Fis family transcriptional regulator, partial [Polyangiaceae bacterium]|nr:sigma-54-dependent Fis family transcriptional regulator [Polyangiaceae bacterium]
MLTIVAHPNPRRVGDRTTLSAVPIGGSAGISRLEPAFVSPRAARGEPLADGHLSRSPLRIHRRDGGAVELDVRETSTRVVADGVPIHETLLLERAALVRGVVLELADSVALVLSEGEPISEPDDDLGLVGESSEIARVRREIRVLTDLDVTVLVVGETGSGKELVARAIHRAGMRRDRPFVAINMGAIPPSLAGAELFGAERGAFTGAVRDHPGHFRAAEDGTLFLDEVGETPVDVQAMLLRALDSGEVQPLGSSQPRPVRARVIAATDADLEELVRRGAFRAPLLHRLASYTVVVPPLRIRRDDIGRLIQHFLRLEQGQQIGGAAQAQDRQLLSASMIAALCRYDWPGNVRQLRNAVRQLVVGSRGGSVEAGPALARILSASFGGTAAALPTDVARTSPAFEREDRRRPNDVTEDELLQTLRACRWDLKSTAERLRISRTSLYALVEASPHVRRVADIDPAEIGRVYQECAGNLDQMVERLEVSKHALARR